MIQTAEHTETAIEMAEALRDLPGHKIAWLILHNSALRNLVDFSPESLLLTEVLRRLYPEIETEELEATSFGWLSPTEVVHDYRETFIENENE
jgi:predicted component of type VI protein secretion system